jgi:tetratricopeptide (TPR) repeat protein
VISENKARKVVPRWRNFETTASLGELASAREKPDTPDTLLENLVRIRYEQWLSAKTVWHAADLLNSAFVANRGAEFKDVARFVVESGDQAPQSLKDFATRILFPYSTIPSDSITETSAKLHAEIHGLRARLVDEPRNSVVWADLSRLYVALGQADKAVQSMRRALALSPSNRFILRSAGRLYLHINEPKAAMRLLRTDASLALGDPWLAAAEISIASAAELPPKFAKKGLGIANDDSFSDFARAELRSALATLEMDSGKNRTARKLFRDCLVDPNENSLAQVEWAERHVGGLQIEQQQLETPRSFEARGYHAYNRQAWEIALENGLKWLRDESFSIRPALFSSWVASSLLERYDVAEEILLHALCANPRNPQILNNLAFAMISSDRLDDAERYLGEVDPERIKDREGHAVTLTATTGLLLMRRGKTEEGRKLYKHAYELAGLLGLRKYRQMAAVYLAREELLANTPLASAALRAASKEIGENPEPDIRLIYDRVLTLSKAVGQRSAPAH